MIAPTVVFFHVMKCGGTSVRSGLAKGLTGQRRGPDVFELDGQAAMRAVGGTNRENWQFRDALLPYVVRAMAPKLVLGHFRYRNAYVDLLGDTHLVTVLRDPIARFLSAYRYHRYKPGVAVPISMPFNEFVEDPRWAKEGHVYVDVFCGRDDLDPRSDEAVEAAIGNLKRFSAVGLTDRLGDFASQLASTIGLSVDIPLLNTSPTPEGIGERDQGIDEVSLARARDMCAPDFAVYHALFGSGSGAERSGRS